MVIPALRLGVLLVAALACLTLFASPALAQSRGVDLRVVNTQGRTLAEHRQYTGPVTIKTDPGAACFGQGTGGSGDRVELNGSTALGAVKDALPSSPGLRPLSVTDAFADQGFGLGVCGIGGYEARGSSFWYVKRNHVGAQVSGSQLTVRQGDDVLWYRTPRYPPPGELALAAPARAKPKVPFAVTVTTYADDGTRRPRAGASVTGASAPTNAAGRTMVTLGAGTHVIRATDSPAIPSNGVEVCVAVELSGCPDTHGKRIAGSDRADRIVGTAGRDAIWARGGADEVDLRAGGRDHVACGSGMDRVIVHAGDRDDEISANCEQVSRK